MRVFPWSRLCFFDVFFCVLPALFGCVGFGWVGFVFLGGGLDDL